MGAPASPSHRFGHSHHTSKWISRNTVSSCLDLRQFLAVLFNCDPQPIPQNACRDLVQVLLLCLSSVFQESTRALHVLPLPTIPLEALIYHPSLGEKPNRLPPCLVLGGRREHPLVVVPTHLHRWNLQSP